MSPWTDVYCKSLSSKNSLIWCLNSEEVTSDLAFGGGFLWVQFPPLITTGESRLSTIWQKKWRKNRNSKFEIAYSVWCTYLSLVMGLTAGVVLYHWAGFSSSSDSSSGSRAASSSLSPPLRVAVIFWPSMVFPLLPRGQHNTHNSASKLTKTLAHPYSS